MTVPERMGRSLLCVLVADLLTAFLVQVGSRIFPNREVGELAGLFLVQLVASLPMVITAWICWLPVIWLFGRPEVRKRVAFVVIGVVWGPAYLYCLRFRTILLDPHYWLRPQLTDGIGLVLSTLATFIYLATLKRSYRWRIQAIDYDR